MSPRDKNQSTSASRKPAGKRPRTMASRFGAFMRLSPVRWGVRGLGATVAIAFVLSLVVYPVRDYFDQRARLSDKRAEFEALADANEQLFNEVQNLKTPEGVRTAARSQLGYVLPGEDRVALTPMPALPTTLPGTWPYTLVTDIVRVRTMNADNGSGPLAPLAP